MKISNTIKHYKKRVRRKFWPSKCLKSGHNLWFLLYSNVSKCPLHLLIILPSSKFVSADCLFSRACSFSYFTFWGMLTCERHTSEKRRIGKQREALDHHTRPITIQSHWGQATWEVKDQIRDANPTVHRQDQSDQLLVMTNHLHDRCMTPVDTWMSLKRHSYRLDSKWKHH